MSDETTTSVLELANDYLESLDTNSTGEDIEEVKEELEYWEEQVREFEEGTTMYEMAVEERDEWSEELESIEQKRKQREELSGELLSQAGAEFASKGDWTKEQVIKALSHVLTGRTDTELLIQGFSLPEDIDNMSKRDMVEVAKTVHSLSEDALGENGCIDELWDSLQTDTQQSIIQVLADHDELLSSNEISGEIGEEGTDAPGANIRYLRGKVDVDPYYSASGGYTLSLAGTYVWSKYGEEVNNDEIDDTDSNQSPVENEVQDGEPTITDFVDDEYPAKQEGQTEDRTSGVDLSNFEVRK